MSDLVPSNNGFGVVTGTVSPVAFPDVNISSLIIKNSPLGVIGFLGSSGVVNFPMAAGDDTGWLRADNLSDFYYSGTGAYFHYWYQD